MHGPSRLEGWMTGYRRAWESNLAEDVVALFTEDAAYHPSPYEPPWRGHAAIVAGWQARADAPGTADFRWMALLEEGATTVVQGVTRYAHATYSNLWVIRFAPEGRCREFTEWWMEHRPPPGDPTG